MKKTSDAGYNKLSVFVHWISVPLLIGMLVTQLGGSELSSLHIAAGPIVGILILLRVAYRVKRGLPPDNKRDKDQRTRKLARLTIWVFLLAMVVVVVTGYLLPGLALESADTAASTWIDPAYHSTIQNIHHLFSYILAPLLLVHILFSHNPERMFSVDKNGY